jgi:hypothetical protein
LRSRAFLVFVLLGALACKDHQAEREALLRQHLAQMRAAIARHRSETGRHPSTLHDLVPRYLPAIPNDPVAQSNDWRFTTEETVQPSADFQTSTVLPSSSVIIDVHSSAPGADRDGVLYSNY